ncbi:MAG TPA: hypothetical protein VE781_06425, partial [Kineosporiaceae bacterium]|nr:hypothetical protein [Kineosporiaceae bacterium]
PKTPPAWPFGVPTEAEAAEWSALWTRPAASLWQQFGLVHDVAVHVRTSIAFAKGGYTNAALGGLVARQADNLGLTVAGADRNRWSWPPATSPACPASVVPIAGGRGRESRRPSAKDRFRRITTHEPFANDASEEDSE